MVNPAPVHDAWSALASQALLGARAAHGYAAEGALGAALAQVAPGDLPTALAVAGAWRRAGRLPGACDPMGAAAPAEVLPPVGAAAEQLLHRIRETGDRDLLREYLEACAAAGRRVAPIVVPDLLDAGRQAAALRPTLLRVIGARGAWLAAQHGSWSWAQGSGPVVAWATGTGAERLDLLRERRRRAPGEAVDLIASTWEEDQPADRAAFLEVLADGLGPADEALLERALDDRRKEVRQAAVELLAGLQASQLAARCRERLAPLLVWERGVLTVEPPTAYERGWARDGIVDKPPRGTGERAWWLQQLLSCVPVTEWSNAWKAAPVEILAAASKTDWASPLREGLLQACGRCPDPDWIHAFIATGAEIHQIRGLLSRMPLPAAETLLQGIAIPQALSRRVWLDLVSTSGTRWSPAFSGRILDEVEREDADMRDLHLTWLAATLHPAAFARAAGLRDAAGSTPARERAFTLFDLRRQILQEFP